MTELEAIDRAVRLEIYRFFLQHGRPPTPGEAAASCRLSLDDARQAYERLQAGRVIVLAPGRHEILMAAPLSAVPTRFEVGLEDGRRYWGNCVWDALGIPAMLGANAKIGARCGCCDELLRLEIRDGRLLRKDGIVHFGVPARAWWDDIVFT